MKIYALLFPLLLLISRSALKGTRYEQNETCKQILELPSRDSVFLNPVYFCVDSMGNYFYYTSLKTTVCNDTLCQLVLLKVFWDLAGNYTKFDTLQGKPLTKNDHIFFTVQDYNKLQTTLRNDNSILGDKTKDELLDKNQTRYSVKIDGVTSATALEIKSAVVDGALYSTYTLWHLVNGEIRQRIREYTLLRYDVDIELQLLKSKNPKTIIFGLKNLDEKYYFNRFDRILDIMKSGNPFVNFYIAKKMPEVVLAIEENRKSIQSIWNLLDRNTKSILSNYLGP